MIESFQCLHSTGTVFSLWSVTASQHHLILDFSNGQLWAAVETAVVSRLSDLEIDQNPTTVSLQVEADNQP
jgi:hypothetical protein